MRPDTVAMPRPRIVVAGSYNKDLVVRTLRRPQRGETLIGTSFATFDGGKGSNQAIAAARAGAEVWMIGRVGQDSFGDDFLATCAAEGIHATYVARDPAEGTGVAMIMVDGEGDNSIVIVPRANMLLSRADVQAAAETIAGAGALLLQLESPEDSSEHAALLARRHGVPVILNPAPARPLSERFLHLVDVITPNGTEAEMLTGLSVETDSQAEAAAHALLARGVGAVVLTLGSRGSMLVDKEGARVYPGFPVQVVDTTAAGDAFCGTLATALAEGVALSDGVRRANAAGALACTRAGAAPAMPYRHDIDALLAASRHERRQGE